MGRFDQIAVLQSVLLVTPQGLYKYNELTSLRVYRRADIRNLTIMGSVYQRAGVAHKSICILKNRAPDRKHYSYTSISSKMDFFRELRELRGNQGRKEEEEWVISIEPITMIVPPALQDLPERITLESTTSSSAKDDDLPVVGEWENRVITGRLSNLRKAPKDLPAGFRFRAALHHEVADNSPSISGYKKLKEMTSWIPVYVDHFEAGLRFPLPGLIFDLLADYELADYELALTQLTPNNIRFIIGFMLLCARLEIPAKAIVFRSLFQCRLCPNSRGAKWYYLSGREKSQLFKNLLPWDTNMKNQLLEYARKENLIDLETLLTSEQLAVFGFLDVANQFTEGILSSYTMNSSRAESYVFVCAREISSILERQRQRAQGSRGHASSNASQRQMQFDERPPSAPQSRSSSHRGSSSASRPHAEQKVETVAPSARKRAFQSAAAHSSNAPSAIARAAAEPAPMSTSVSVPNIAYPKGFSYVKMDCQPAMVQGMQSFVPLVDRQRARTFVQQHGGQVAMVKLMDAFSYGIALFESEQGARAQNSKLSTNCKQLAAEKASLVDDVNHLQGSEMGTEATSVESQAEELTSRNNKLREEMERARAEKESAIQAAKVEAARIEEWAKKAEVESDRTLNELSSLRHQVTEADKNLNAAEEALNELKTSHGRFVSIARAQGVEWLVGSAAFQDAVAVASANMTTENYNEIRGKVLQHRPDFPIRELAFFDGENLDEQRKSLSPLVDATVWLRWELNEDGEPLSTPPNSQPVVAPARSPVSAPAPEPIARSPPARSSTPAAANTSMPSI
ncbi:hypothetical protein SLEP1_g12507 [Rubroshorea leprosula]|uniref:Transposase (putative) gypsy type domain-containing protein n=1 Tax=Rubroshorea leprosula TaxID=152421 RepID=A0AAV5IIH5_9ROSI|nr:hypothetical protein SLEP1_g12507 [Rubroshorea leprosula]